MCLLTLFSIFMSTFINKIRVSRYFRFQNNVLVIWPCQGSSCCTIVAGRWNPTARHRLARAMSSKERWLTTTVRAAPFTSARLESTRSIPETKSDQVNITGWDFYKIGQTSDTSDRCSFFVNANSTFLEMRTCCCDCCKLEIYIQKDHFIGSYMEKNKWLFFTSVDIGCHLSRDL